MPIFVTLGIGSPYNSTRHVLTTFWRPARGEVWCASKRHSIRITTASGKHQILSNWQATMLARALPGIQKAIHCVRGQCICGRAFRYVVSKPLRNFAPTQCSNIACRCARSSLVFIDDRFILSHGWDGDYYDGIFPSDNNSDDDE